MFREFRYVPVFGEMESRGTSGDAGPLSQYVTSALGSPSAGCQIDAARACHVDGSPSDVTDRSIIACAPDKASEEEEVTYHNHVPYPYMPQASCRVG